MPTAAIRKKIRQIPWETINHVLIIVGTFACFIAPIAAPLWPADLLYHNPTLQQYLLSEQFSSVAVASAVIVSPSLADAVLDLYVWWKTPVEDREGGDKKASSKVEHMTIYERILFCLGMMISLIPREPRFQAEGLAEQYYAGFSAANALLCITPIVMFLCRVNKKVWTNFRAFFVILCIVVSAVLQGLTALWPGDSRTYSGLTSASGGVMAVALGVYVLNTAVQVVRLVYFRRTLRRRRRKALQGSSAASSGGSDTGGLTAGSLGSVDSGSTDEEEKGINYETAMAHTLNTGYVFIVVNFVSLLMVGLISSFFPGIQGIALHQRVLVRAPMPPTHWPSPCTSLTSLRWSLPGSCTRRLMATR